jgi:glyoxylase-like metal-dependent hydrolase (beta-lactamase superfamily II)
VRFQLRPCSRLTVATLILLVGAGATRSGAQNERSMTQVAEGVYVIRHRTTPFEGGNTTVIVGERDVLVIDACLFPYAAREDIAQIRTLTTKPVRYLLNTHWHNDHVMGNHEYAKAFPGLAIIAHAETRRDMDLNIPNATKRSLPNHTQLATQESAALTSGKGTDGKPFTAAQRAQVESLLVRRRTIIDDYTTFVYQPPTTTFDRELTLDLGNREVRITHLGRGNTNGDAVVFLPKERVAISGDLLVRPFPFPYDGYPSEWIATLDRLGQLDATVIVPGHGEIMRDKTYLYLVRDLFRSAVDQVNARIHVIGPAEFQEVAAVLPHVNLSAFRQRFAGENPEAAKQFDEVATQVVKLVFKEAALR